MLGNRSKTPEGQSPPRVRGSGLLILSSGPRGVVLSQPLSDRSLSGLLALVPSLSSSNDGAKDLGRTLQVTAWCASLGR